METSHATYEIQKEGSRRSHAVHRTCFEAADCSGRAETGARNEVEDVLDADHALRVIMPGSVFGWTASSSGGRSRRRSGCEGGSPCFSD
jgi:hypothetical protein